MTQASHTAMSSLGRASRTAVYIEPELYMKAMTASAKNGISYSTLVRKLLIRNLKDEGHLSDEEVMRLVGA